VFNIKKTWTVRIIVVFKNVRVTIVAVRCREKQEVLHILGMYL